MLVVAVEPVPRQSQERPVVLVEVALVDTTTQRLLLEVRQELPI
jgi:hypothetical protein